MQNALDQLPRQQEIQQFKDRQNHRFRQEKVSQVITELTDHNSQLINNLTTKSLEQKEQLVAQSIKPSISEVVQEKITPSLIQNSELNIHPIIEQSTQKQSIKQNAKKQSKWKVLFKKKTPVEIFISKEQSKSKVEQSKSKVEQSKSKLEQSKSKQEVIENYDYPLNELPLEHQLVQPFDRNLPYYGKQTQNIQQHQNDQALKSKIYKPKFKEFANNSNKQFVRQKQLDPMQKMFGRKKIKSNQLYQQQEIIQNSQSKQYLSTTKPNKKPLYLPQSFGSKSEKQKLKTIAQKQIQQQKKYQSKNKGAKGHYKIFTPEHFESKDTKSSIHRWTFGTGVTPSKIKISSWNINGIRARTINGDILPYLQSSKPDIFCVNEHKMDQKSYVENPIKYWGYHSYWNFPKYSLGYSGVAIFSKFPAIQMFQDIHIPQHSKQGRVITLEFQKFILVHVYIPTSGRQLQRLKYRANQYDPAFLEYIQMLQSKYPDKTLIICGDINVAHNDLDCHTGKRMLMGKQPAFTYEQRKNFSILLKDADLVDTFRYFYPTTRQYTWWNMRRGGRQRAGQTGIGKRLDYFLVNKESMKYVKSSQVKKDVQGNDHCPIELELQFS